MEASSIGTNTAPNSNNDNKSTPVINISASLAAIQCNQASSTRTNTVEGRKTTSSNVSGSMNDNSFPFPTTPLRVKTQTLDDEESDVDEEAIRRMLASPAMSELTASPSWNSKDRGMVSFADVNII